MPSISAPSTPNTTLKKVNGEFLEDPLLKALDRTMEIKLLRMEKFLKEHKDELHLHVSTLRHYASSSGGLVTDNIRSIVWPILAMNLVNDLGSEQESSTASNSEYETAISALTEGSDDESYAGDKNSERLVISPSDSDLHSHSEWNQVEMDVNRTLARFPPNICDEDRVILQKILTPMIIRILWICPRFSYYQGFHDVCLTLLLVLGEKTAENVGVCLVQNGVFNGYLLRTLEDTVLRDLDLMYIILWKLDSELEKTMRSVHLGTFFALSWPLTWFSHALHHYQQIVLCFDLFLATHPLMPIYFASAVVLWRGSSIQSCVKEMPLMHHLLNIMPDKVPIQALVADAQDIFRLIPPAVLRDSLMKGYRDLLQVTKTKRPSVPVTLLGRWFVAGTATAAIYILSRYLFLSS